MEPKRPRRPARPQTKVDPEACPIHGHMTGQDPHEVEAYMKAHIPPLRTFVVRRPSLFVNRQPGEPAHYEQAVEAHTYQDRQCGALSFTRYVYDEHQGTVMQLVYLVLAPGTWYDAREITADVATRSAN